jgi:hypothetical protein
MLKFISDPILAAIGVVDGVIGKTTELIGTAVGRAEISEEADTEEVEAEEVDTDTHADATTD